MPSSATAPVLSARPPAGPRKGHTEPRIYTKPLGPLVPGDEEAGIPCTSLGYACIEFSELVLGIILWPWQKWLLIHALELGPDGAFRFRTLIILVARQNGKTTVLTVLSLFFTYVLGIKMVIGTAQKLDTAEETWGIALETAQNIEDLSTQIGKVNLTNGAKFFRLQTGERYKVAAATRRGARGFTGDLLLLDELREHQTWEAWAASTKTTMARPDALICGFSNAGDASSIVLRSLRLRLHADLGNPDKLEEVTDLIEAEGVDPEMENIDGDTMGLFEWSASPGRTRWDREGWAEANPSLGYMITERAIASAAKTDPDSVFLQEILCQWSSTTAESPFGPGAWEACADEDSSLAGGFTVSCQLSWNRSTGTIAVAGFREDGTIHGEVVAKRAGPEWMAAWIKEKLHSAPIIGVISCSSGMPVSTEWAALEAASKPDPETGWPGFTLVDWKGPERAIGTGELFDLVSGDEGAEGEFVPGLAHLNQPQLNVSATTSRVMAAGQAYVWDLKNSPQDAAPVMALTGAVHLLLNQPEPEVKSAYDDDDFSI